jgi:hypothetical protein
MGRGQERLGQKRVRRQCRFEDWRVDEARKIAVGNHLIRDIGRATTRTHLRAARCQNRTQAMPWPARLAPLTSSSSQSLRLFLAYSIFRTFAACFFFVCPAVPMVAIAPTPPWVGVDLLGPASEGTNDDAGMSVGLVRCVGGQ